MPEEKSSGIIVILSCYQSRQARLINTSYDLVAERVVEYNKLSQILLLLTDTAVILVTE